MVYTIYFIVVVTWSCSLTYKLFLRDQHPQALKLRWFFNALLRSNPERKGEVEEQSPTAMGEVEEEE